MACLQIGGRQLIGTPGDQCCGHGYAQDEFAMKEESRHIIDRKFHYDLDIDWENCPPEALKLSDLRTCFDISAIIAEHSFMLTDQTDRCS